MGLQRLRMTTRRWMVAVAVVAVPTAAVVETARLYRLSIAYRQLRGRHANSEMHYRGVVKRAEAIANELGKLKRDRFLVERLYYPTALTRCRNRMAVNALSLRSIKDAPPMDGRDQARSEVHRQVDHPHPRIRAQVASSQIYRCQ